MFTYQLEKYNNLIPTLVQLFVAPTTEVLSYQSGQYIEILYPNNTWQPFSIANAPLKNGMIELHVRCYESDTATKKWLDEIQQQKKIIFRGPFGKSCYQNDPNKSVLLLAGGAGFAQIKAVIEAALSANDKRNFHLYWGVKTPIDFYLPHLPQQWQQRFSHFLYTPIISQPQNSHEPWHGKTGYIPPQVIADYPDLSHYQVYISGPFAMAQSAYQLFLQHGLQSDNMQSDMLS